MGTTTARARAAKVALERAATRRRRRREEAAKRAATKRRRLREEAAKRAREAKARVAVIKARVAMAMAKAKAIKVKSFPSYNRKYKPGYKKETAKKIKLQFNDIYPSINKQHNKVRYNFNKFEEDYKNINTDKWETTLEAGDSLRKLGREICYWGSQIPCSHIGGKNVYPDNIHRERRWWIQ